MAETNGEVRPRIDPEQIEQIERIATAIEVAADERPGEAIAADMRLAAVALRARLGESPREVVALLEQIGSLEMECEAAALRIEDLLEVVRAAGLDPASTYPGARPTTPALAMIDHAACVTLAAHDWVRNRSGALRCRRCALKYETYAGRVLNQINATRARLPPLVRPLLEQIASFAPRYAGAEDDASLALFLPVTTVRAIAQAYAEVQANEPETFARRA